MPRPDHVVVDILHLEKQSDITFPEIDRTGPKRGTGMGAFNRLHAFLPQMFDYGNTDIEKRFLFYRRLIPLLESGCEREEVDLSKGGAHPPRAAQRRRAGKAAGVLDEIIERVNGLFEDPHDPSAPNSHVAPKEFLYKQQDMEIP